jgi:hypothetical protein
MRPLGEISMALHEAAASSPGSVRDLAYRAQVGYDAARYTASRMVDRGELVIVQQGRPAVLGVATAQTPGGDELASALDDLHRSFWSGAMPQAERDDSDEFLAL